MNAKANSRLWGRIRIPLVAVVLLVAGAVVLAAGRLGTRQPDVPTAEVKLGEFTDSLSMRGEIKAFRSLSLAAPAEAGDLQIVKIIDDGSQVKTGDPVVEFDKTRTEQDLAQYRSALKSAEAEIEQARAQARLSEEEDVTAVMKAKYDVESAKLEASKQEIISVIEGEKNRLKVTDAEQRLREAEEKQKSDRSASQAAIEDKIQASKKASFDVERAERALREMTLRAPQAGVISLLQLWRGDGMKVFKTGDRAWPGAPIAEIPDISTLRVHARVDETERGRLKKGQLANVQMDAIPDRQFTGHIDMISSAATMDFSGGWPFPNNFDVQILLDQNDNRIKPGLNAQLSIVTDEFLNVLSIPAQAAFQKSGRTIAYVFRGAKFQEQEIQASRRSGDRILVEQGLRAGDRVALKDPAGKE